MKATNPKIFGLILAGGYSLRMGQDKALLKFNGKPQIENVLGLLQRHCDQIYLSKRADQKNYKDLAFINDAQEFADKGPLGGILSAMKAFPNNSFLVIACDLPLITNETIETLIKLRNPQKIATAYISSQDALPEPLCAIWEGWAYDSILNLFNNGIHCPRKVLIKSQTHLIAQTDPHWLDNVNTPEEYKRINSSFSV